MQLNSFLGLRQFGTGVRTALILRGLPGAGKSTLVQKLQERYPERRIFVASADAERIGADGVYRWTSDFKAHFAANRKFVEAIQDTWAPSGISSRDPWNDIVVMDNTNIELIHIAPYVSVAASYGYSPMVVTIACDPDTSFRRNTHSVPMRNIERWHQRLGQIAIPKEWSHVIIDPIASPGPIGQD